MDPYAYSFADGDTPVTALSWEAATSAAGTVIAAVDAVCTGAKVNAFCAGEQRERQRTLQQQLHRMLLLLPLYLVAALCISYEGSIR